MREQEITRINEKQRQVFDELYYRFLEPLPQDVLDRMELIVAAAMVAGETVLDVGTGTGALIPFIRKYHPRRVVACDLSGKMLEQVARLHPEVERYQCDVRDLRLPSASLDVVFMNAVFGNIADKVGAMKNTVRMLRPGGRVVISHPEGRAFVARIAQTAPFPLEPFPSKEGFYTFLGSFGLTVTHYVDEEKLLLVVAIKDSNGAEKKTLPV
jgi:ubiquinone/menaquinone biosynthesis C-methylase UbiE